MLSPDSRAKSCPLSGRSSTYRPVQIPETGSQFRFVPITYLHREPLGQTRSPSGGQERTRARSTGGLNMSKWFVTKTRTRSPSRRSFFSTSGDSQAFFAAIFLTVAIIVLGPVCARADVDDVKLVGDDQADRTASGLWPFGRPGVVKRDRGYVAPVSPGAAPRAVHGSGSREPTGRSWTQQTTSGVRPWNGIACDATCTKLVAVATSELVYTSTDSGATWTGQTGSLFAGYMGVASSSDGTKLVAVALDL